MPEEIYQEVIEKQMKEAYIDYAMSVIVSRALPDVKDGLKPVHRRILYAMKDQGMVYSKPSKKSARIVGECFVKDTMVLTEKGLIPIQDLKIGDKVYTQNGLENVSELYIMPKRPLLKVTLKNGIENIATKSQMFKVMTREWEFKWKEAKDLKIGDHIIIKSSFPEIDEEVKIGDKKLNSNIAYMLGFLMSDGWIENDTRAGFYSNSESIINRVKEVLEIEFEYVPTIEIKDYEYMNANGLITVNRGFTIRINRKVINQYLIETFGLHNLGAETKHIPAQILRSPKQVIFSFISGLMDGDGSVHKERNIIHYGSISYKLCKDLALLLQHFDIHGHIYETKPKKGRKVGLKNINNNNKFYSLEISGVSAQKLAGLLNLSEERKAERLKRIIDKTIKKNDYDILPFGGSKIFKELSENHLGGGWYKDENGDKFRSGTKYPCGLKIRYAKDLYDKPLRISQIIEWGLKEKLKKIGSELFELVESIAKDKIYFIPVKSIVNTEEDVTYDIQVSNKHEFVANGMISHNCLGKYHPHGDASVYDALVRMAQSFSLRYPLIMGQGNFGSIDGDSAAHMRYTEAKMSRIADEMLTDIDKDTVDFTPNFDNSLKEPVVLPAMLPNLLLNGSTGIAVGMATNIPPHNLTEVSNAILHLIDNPNTDPLELMQFIKGPDFPTGGIIMGSGGIRSAYKFGKGMVRVRAKASVEDNDKRKQIIVTEIPYMVNKSTLIENMAELVNEKKIEGITDIRDESDRDGIRVVIDLKKDASSEVILNQLYAKTQLQSSFGVNMLALHNNQPKVMTVTDILGHYIEHRKDVIVRRCKFDLKKAEDRAHILEGLKIALQNIDDIVQTIKESNDPAENKESLMKLI